MVAPAGTAPTDPWKRQPVWGKALSVPKTSAIMVPVDQVLYARRQAEDDHMLSKSSGDRVFLRVDAEDTVCTSDDTAAVAVKKKIPKKGNKSTKSKTHAAVPPLPSDGSVSTAKSKPIFGWAASLISRDDCVIYSEDEKEGGCGEPKDELNDMSW
ncbi:hypothetical protein EVG20_g11270 [Dentipellis fragilis]|uniref:Uncharacterized protein n=1 Tax=Dentipellis fragilis TaxID=205917 RepID=A0A4Y9XLG1_9AGAM|nr:hypothetical protein EVG20_g11270 [Dentipellis fragilis]